jgi:hypothetical protein
MPFYNEIQDVGDSYILWKNPELQDAGINPFKDMHIQWGYEPSINRVLIKSMIYPKSHYSLEKVKVIAKETENCPHCKKGSTLSLNNRKSNNYLTINNKNNEEENMSFKFQLPKIPGMPNIKKTNTKGASITKFADPIFKNNVKLSQQLLVQTYSQLIQLLLGFAIPEKIIQKGIKAVAGFIITIANELGMGAGRLKDELRILGTNMMTSAIDPDMGDIQRMQREAQEISARFRFGNPLDIFKFQDPINPIKRLIQDAQTAIANINLGGAGKDLMLALGGVGSPFQLGGAGSQLMLGTNIGRNPGVVTPIRPNLVQNQTSRVSQRIPGGQEITGFRINATVSERGLR